MTSTENKAVFLSYASRDAAAVERIAEALRAAGVEVWFDKDELVGGDAWDQKIRRQIKECAIFVPIISANTQARAEGYFRLEWKLAVDRSHLMADDAPFLFPVVIDDTSDSAARVPDKFREVQWTRLNVKDTPETLARRISRLVGGSPAETAPAALRPVDATPDPAERGWWAHWWWLIFPVFGMVMGLVHELKRTAPAPTAAPAVDAPPAAPVPTQATPPRSEARQLADRARALFDKINSNADDFAVAESLLKRALELDATDGEIWAYSARLNAAYLTRSFERGSARAEVARNHAERAVKLAPESAEAWHALGRAIWRSDPPRAEDALRHALQLAPDDGRILLSLGSICRNSGREEDALAYYVRAATHPEVRPLALYDQFLIHLYQRRFAEADRCGREAAALLPTTNSITGIAILEIVWHGQVAAAQRTLADAPAVTRGEPRMVFATALGALMAKQPDEALRALDRLPGDFINDAWYSGPKALFTGLAHMQGGRPEAARIAWESGLAVVRRRLSDTANDPELHLRCGELLAWSGQTEAALREARIFEELARNHTDWTFSSARIYAALGRADEALPILEKFLTMTGGGRWPLTPALLRLDPIWDRIRGDPRFQALGAEPVAATVAAPFKPDDKSVAVLAFANLSDDKANEYFSDGISEELLNVLAKIPDLKVSARTSAFSFKGKNVPIPEIAQQLGVAYVVEGSVRKAGDKVRITAQLIKAADGFHVWSDTFTRELKDVFAVQDEIAGLIAKNISPKLTQSAPAATGRPVDPEAFQLYLQGRALATKAGLGDLRQAIALFERAARRDPGFHPARVQAARAYTQLGRWGGMVPQEAWTAAKAALTPALAADPDSPEALVAQGWLLRTADWKWREAEQAFARALAQRPSDPDVLVSAAVLKTGIGRSEEGQALARRALELDPLNPATQFDLGLIYRFSDRLPEAERQFRRAIELSPSGQRYRTFLALVVAALGRYDEAETLARNETDELSRLFVFGLAAAGRGDRARLREIIAQLEAKGATLGKLGDYYAYLAGLRGEAGDLDGGMAALDAARAAHDPSIGWIKVNYVVRSLHRHPRWNDFLRSVGLADDQLK